MKIGQQYKNWTRNQVVEVIDIKPLKKELVYRVISGNEENKLKVFWNPVGRFNRLYFKVK